MQIFLAAIENDLQDMKKQFRNKAHSFADKMVEEVMASQEKQRDASQPLQRSETEVEGAEAPLAYRDSSRASEYGEFSINSTIVRYSDFVMIRYIKHNKLKKIQCKRSKMQCKIIPVFPSIVSFPSIDHFSGNIVLKTMRLNKLLLSSVRRHLVQYTNKVVVYCTYIIF